MIPVDGWRPGRSSVDGLVARRLGLPEEYSRTELETLQLRRLRETVAWAQERSPWYRSSLAELDPASFDSLEDLARLPFLSSANIAASGHLILCVSQSEVARIITLQTSGSTGHPKRIYFTPSDLDSTAQFFLHGMLSLVDVGWKVLVMLPTSIPDSTGDLLMRVLPENGIPTVGQWPPLPWREQARAVRKQGIDCVIGLPQHQLALAEHLQPGNLKTMLLCSDYSPEPLRKRIEAACGCETFVHYGTTESGLGGGVECSFHAGCHLRDGDLLIEIIDPESGRVLSDREPGEVVLTTIGRKGMPLLRYRTGDRGWLDRSICACGGVTTRLCGLTGRMVHHVLPGGLSMTSQELDDTLFLVPGLLDYRAVLTRNARERLDIEFLSRTDDCAVRKRMEQVLVDMDAINSALKTGRFELGSVQAVSAFSPSHTIKRTIVDHR